MGSGDRAFGGWGVSLFYIDEAWEKGAGGDNDMSVISVLISIIEIVSETFLGWLNELKAIIKGIK